MQGRRQIHQKGATHTRVRVTVYSWDGDGAPGRVDGFDSDFGHVLACSTTKQLGPAAGSWTVSLKKPPVMGAASWHSLWYDPEDTWVLIQWVIDGQLIDGLYGLIDSIAEASVWEKAGGSETYTISGRDVGKAFEQTQCFVNVHADTAAQSALAIQTRFTPRGIEPPGHFVNLLAEAWIGNYDAAAQPWMLPPGMPRQSLWALLLDRVGCMDPEIDGVCFDPTLMAPDGARPLWSFMQEYSNGLMNELFVDLAPAESLPANALTGLLPALTLRRRPFPTSGDRTAWDALPTHELTPHDVGTRNVTKGGPAQRFNYWLFGTLGSVDGIAAQALLHDTGATAGRPGSIPIWNVNSIQRHGLRLWQQDAGLFVPLNLDVDAEARLGLAGDRPSWMRLAARWLSDIHDWYVTAPLELSGSIHTTRMYPEVRIGHRIRENGYTYYVEGVANSWTMGQRGSTTITVTRGEHDDAHLLEAVYAEMDRGLTSRDRLFMPREALQTFDESTALDRDGAYMESAPLNIRARVDAMTYGLDRGEVSEGEGFTTTGDGAGPTAGEGGDVTPTTERQLGHMPPETRRDARTRRAFRGEDREDLAPGTSTALGNAGIDETAQFDQAALEAGEPIPVDTSVLDGFLLEDE